jgi:8-oxo-dGTP pyrophosphatase MutT (NUDIX family)
LNDLIKIKHVVQTQLPGEEAHLALSPMGRKRSSEAIIQAKNVRQSAVAIVLFDRKNTLHAILTERNTYIGKHSGQICFPGGKSEESDSTLEETAKRECYEETGISISELNLIGTLTPVYIPVSNHYVHPYIFHHRGEPVYKLDTYEVKEIFDFPLKSLHEPDRIKTTIIQIEKGKYLKNVPYFDLNQKIVWGATGIILNELKEVCKIAGVV